MIHAALFLFYTFTDMHIHTFLVFMYYDDIMNFITLVYGYEIDSAVIPHRISQHNRGTT